ncbi:MAG: DUF3795 domain-containing protein [Chloroflexota bacterium]|nr:MAG: DUF3795 domain-containing protein [Chloroflexota bacterium]
MADLRLVTYCGLYCGLCSQVNRTPQRALDLKDSMQKEGYEHWGQDIPGFREFWAFLNSLIESRTVSSCREGNCGPPFCAIRKCAQGKSIDICVSCEDYPCKRVLGIAEGYPTLLADGKRMKKIGIEAWIDEQEQRAKTGFAYVDIRCYPYGVPDE